MCMCVCVEGGNHANTTNAKVTQPLSFYGHLDYRDKYSAHPERS